MILSWTHHTAWKDSPVLQILKTQERCCKSHEAQEHPLCSQNSKSEVHFLAQYLAIRQPGVTAITFSQSTHEPSLVCSWCGAGPVGAQEVLLEPGTSFILTLTLQRLQAPISPVPNIPPTSPKMCTKPQGPCLPGPVACQHQRPQNILVQEESKQQT